MLKLLILSTLLAGTLATITADASTIEKPEEYCNEYYMKAYESYKIANVIFSGKLFQEMVRAHPGQNVFVSGPVVLDLLAELALNADPCRDTYKQIMSTLHFGNVKYIECFYYKITQMVMVAKEYQWISKVYSNTKCPLSNNFLTQAEEIFVFGARNLNFEDPESAKIINEEVASSTGNQIFDFIEPKQLSKYDGLLLVSADYFKAPWFKPFNRKYTRLRNFYVSRREVMKLPTMYQRGTFLYSDCPRIGGRILKLDYAGNESFLIIINPYQTKNIPNIVEKISNPDIFMPAFDSLRPRDVEIYLPRFNRTASLEMKRYIEKIQVSAIFSNQTANLGNITTNCGTYVSQIIQKQTMQVDELGTGVEKYTGCNCRGQRPRGGNPIVFRVNHPFIYLLYYRDFIVFFGIFVR